MQKIIVALKIDYFQFHITSEVKQTLDFKSGIEKNQRFVQLLFHLFRGLLYGREWRLPFSLHHSAFEVHIYCWQ